MAPQLVKKPTERRSKTRFPMRRELRYRLLENDSIVASGVGETIDIASHGVAFQIDRPLRAGMFIELSISWPMMLPGDCPLRLVIFGLVVRSAGRRSACRLIRYEFRTQARVLQPIPAERRDARLHRWAGACRDEAAGF